MSDTKEAAARQHQEAAAESLKRQIEDLLGGKNRAARPASLRDFIDHKMAEDKRRDDDK